MKMILLTATLIGSLSTTMVRAAEAGPTEATKTKIMAALQHERRPEADRSRDKNRKPLETLSFFRLQDHMTVLELVPGGGWYTRILGPVLEEKGKLYLSIGTDRIAGLLEKTADTGFGSTEIIPFNSENISRGDNERRYSLPEFSFGIRKIDLVLTFRNLHNFTEQARANLNTAALRALRKGGYYGVVDHTRRHMQADSDEVWRRMDPVQMIREIEAAGFKFLEYSDLHHRLDDELRYEVGLKTVTGNTDRFTLLFVKP